MSNYDLASLYRIGALAERLAKQVPEDRKETDSYLLTNDEVAFVDDGPEVVLALMHHLRMLIEAAGGEE